MLREISQAPKNKYCIISFIYVESKKVNLIVERIIVFIRNPGE
jgi:hypothetical protein